MKLHGEEPEFAPWRAVPAAVVVGALLRRRPSGRAMVVAVDGRSGGGKTTAAATLQAAASDVGERAVVLHTDDVAWWQACFDWDRLLTEHVLHPVLSGDRVHWRPPAWVERGRAGAIDVPEGTTLLVVEGVGAARRSLEELLDAAVWVQSDLEQAHRRGIERDCVLHGRTRAEAETTWNYWMIEELPHLANDRPWERADLVVAGTDTGTAYGEGDLVVSARSPMVLG